MECVNSAILIESQGYVHTEVAPSKVNKEGGLSTVMSGLVFATRQLCSVQSLGPDVTIFLNTVAAVVHTVAA